MSEFTYIPEGVQNTQQAFDWLSIRAASVLPRDPREADSDSVVELNLVAYEVNNAYPHYYPDSAEDNNSEIDPWDHYETEQIRREERLRKLADQGRLAAAIFSSGVYQSEDYPFEDPDDYEIVGELVARSYANGNFSLEDTANMLASPAWEDSFAPNRRADDAAGFENLIDMYKTKTNGALEYLAQAGHFDEAEALIQALQVRVTAEEISFLTLKRLLPHLFVALPGDNLKQPQAMISEPNEEHSVDFVIQEDGFDSISRWAKAIRELGLSGYQELAVAKFPGDFQSAREYLQQRGLEVGPYYYRDHARNAVRAGRIDVVSEIIQAMPTEHPCHGDIAEQLNVASDALLSVSRQAPEGDHTTGLTALSETIQSIVGNLLNTASKSAQSEVYVLQMIARTFRSLGYEEISSLLVGRIEVLKSRER